MMKCNEIVSMTKWCKLHNLLLNVKKTKEMVFDFKKRPNVINRICIDNESVGKYKYLGTVISSDLKWSNNINEQFKKASKRRLYFLRKLREFAVDKTILNLFYKSVIESVAVFGIIVWYSCASQYDKNHLERTREGFFKKKHSCGFIFSKLCYTPIFLIHIFSIKINHLSMNIFSINIYTCPVNMHCHFNCTVRFRP